MPILKNEQLDQQLKEKGYVIFPFLGEAELESLRNSFTENHPAEPEGFYATSHSTNLEFRKKMNQAIQSVVNPLIEQHLDQVQALGGAFISKGGGPGGILPPHQDWNIVDETKFRSFNLWVPLVEVNEINGAVEVLPSSHKMRPTFRGPNLPNAFQNILPKMWYALEPLTMPAGHALLYDHRLVHGSPANKSDQLRTAIVYGIIPKEAEMHYYYREGEEIAVYKSNVDFWFSHDPSLGPGNQELEKKIPFKKPYFSLEEVEAFLKKHGHSIPEEWHQESAIPKNDANWLSKFVNLFKKD